MTSSTAPSTATFANSATYVFDQAWQKELERLGDGRRPLTRGSSTGTRGRT